MRILSLALAEHLPKLKEQGLNLDPYYRPSNEKDGPHITKEEVIVHLEQIDQYKLAEILSEDKGKSITKLVMRVGCLRDLQIAQSLRVR